MQFLTGVASGLVTLWIWRLMTKTDAAPQLPPAPVETTQEVVTTTVTAKRLPVQHNDKPRYSLC